MDRNEAIDILRVIAPPRTSKKAFYDFMEARDMAIAALEQALPLKTCEGCKHLGKWENEVEYGYSSPCTRCRRRTEDYYEK